VTNILKLYLSIFSEINEKLKQYLNKVSLKYEKGIFIPFIIILLHKFTN